MHIAIPAMDEADFLPRTMAAVYSQVTNMPYQVYICVNQPDEWWDNPEKLSVCQNNQRTLDYLKTSSYPHLHILDHSSRQQGWTGKNYGVGWARKTLFDEILKQADNQDIIISLDADTILRENYFQSIADSFERKKKWAAISLPYYHPLSGNEDVDRAMLHYEIYMRNYFLNLHRIGCPYTFTAIGSSMAIRCSALRKIGGITPTKSGEDFYLLQKLCKTRQVGNWNEEYTYPAARFSSRVFFGTGPALIKGAQGDWESYPIYHYSLFDEIEQTYRLIPELFKKDIDNPFLSFLNKQFKSENLWQPLRENFKDLPHFQKAFHEKADALRILQYLKQEQKRLAISDTEALSDNLQHLFGYDFPYRDMMAVPMSALRDLRDFLFTEENNQRREEGYR